MPPGGAGRLERKKVMAKKRRCRRTADENTIHEKAVKMRKMTDEQLVNYVYDSVEKARSEGFNQGKKKSTGIKINVQSIIDDIGGIKGIGETKLREISGVLRKQLEGYENA